MAGDESAKLVQRAPVTAYDILGYIVPGGLLLLALAAFESLARKYAENSPGSLHTPVYTALESLFTATAVNASWGVTALLLVTLGTAAYITGHVVASISALAIDRWYVYKAHGYPFRHMLALDDEESESYSRDFHRGFFFWLNLYFLLRYLLLPGGIAVRRFLPEPFQDFLPNALTPVNLRWAAIAVGWLLVIMSIIKMLLSTRSAEGQGTLSAVLETAGGKRVAEFLERVLRALAVPAQLITRLLGNYLHTRNRLDVASAEAFKQRLLATVGLELTGRNARRFFESSSTFWYATLHVRASAQAVAEPAENWLRLYGFARNLAAALYLAFLYCLMWWFNQGSDLRLVSSEARHVILVLPLVYWACAFVMLLRYYYLYVDYYTKYILRAFVYLTRPASSE